MFLPFLLIAQDIPGKALNEPPRYTQCMDLATGEPEKGVEDAARWYGEGGGAFARQCLGVAYANQGKWVAAAGALEDAAREAELKRDVRAAKYRAQAANAWLAAGEHAKARAALDSALASGALQGLELGEAHLDRARALVASGDLELARGDLDRAALHAANDPLVWLLSATLARRTGDMPRAAKDIAEALRRSPDDASVQLEAGNIAAAAGDEANARTAWSRAIELAPGSAQAVSARSALEQFGATEK